MPAWVLTGAMFLAAVFAPVAAFAASGQPWPVSPQPWPYPPQPWPSGQAGYPFPAQQPWPAAQPWPAGQASQAGQAPPPAAPASAAGSAGGSAEPSRDWSATIGMGAAMIPEYMGSDAYIPWPMPIIEINWKDKVFLSADDGMGWNMVNTRNFRLGPMIHYYRGSNDYPSGMDSVEPGGQVGMFVDFRFGHFRLDAKALYAFSGSSEGARANAGLSYGMKINKTWKIIVRAEADYFNDNEMKTYFGVSPREASGNASTGFGTYSAGQGVADVGLGADIVYRFSGKWNLVAKLKASRLLGDAADSPLSTQDFQGYGGLGLAYSF